MKIKLLDPKVLKPKKFCNKRSYEAALYAVEVCNNVIKKFNAGYTVLHYESLAKPTFKVTASSVVYQVTDTTGGLIVGYEFDDDDLVYCTKRAVREYFKLWRICKLVNVTKAYDLTK